ncbi:MAG: hypothetical protein ACLFUJ_08750 [Phycisphaerae bacterium]
MSNVSELTLTYRHGKLLAGYVRLPGSGSMTVARSQREGKGMVADFADDGRCLGLEITSPSHVTPQEINAVLTRLHAPRLDEQDLAPLRSA